MSDINNNVNNQPEEEMSEIFTLTDEDGNDVDFEIIADYEKDGQRYFAMLPVNDEPKDENVYEYVILKLAKDGDEDVLVSVDDDDELDDIADYFDDLFSQEIDYDED